MSNHENDVLNRITDVAGQTDVSGLSRRKFLGGIGGAAAATMAAGVVGSVALEPLVNETAAEAANSNSYYVHRRNEAWKIRKDAADYWKGVGMPQHPVNGDETRYANRIANFTKGLPHNSFGEVDANAYQSLLDAIDSSDPADFDAVIMSPGGRKMVSPQGGMAFDLEGADSHALAVPAPPALASAEQAGEGVEHYWMKLLLDTNFLDYNSNADAADAAANLNQFGADFKGPKAGGQVTPQTLFRDVLPGATVGPYISQFMWMNTPFGTEYIERRQRTLLPDTSHLTNYADWLTAQNGYVPGAAQHDPVRRYIRNGRDLAEWVHIDVLFQAYFNACLILGTPPSSDPLSGGIGCPPNPGNPYIGNLTQDGFTTFGPPHFKALLCEVATRSLKVTWHKKWQIHRRLRPEAWGGLVHNQITSNRYPGIIDARQLNSPAVARTFSKYGSYLLPQAFPEGSPIHPTYTAGHATVAGACVTILKALFDERHVIPNPVVPTPDGLALVPYTGPALTVGGELNKVASNVATGRNIAGVHWRSDAIESMRLGEALAISILRDQRALYNENFNGFTFTKFDGTTVTV
ncbi:MAG TPA: vanadium-dependent haloperoxidase [Thermoanaerobaculia bacterium]|nr:vanadium-dependent haloperoxidase [Thermoanaerobaculia bacterium]